MGNEAVPMKQFEYYGIRVQARSWDDFLNKLEEILLWRKRHGLSYRRADLLNG